MKNEIEAMITDITTTTAEAEDYRGRAFILRQVPYAQRSLLCRGKDLFRA